MRFAQAMTLVALSLLAALLGPARIAHAQEQSYRSLYSVGMRQEALAAATPPGETRIRNYRLAAATFERALLARDRQGIADYGIHNALGTVYLGAGELARADAHIQRGLAIAPQMTPADRARLYHTAGYLNALRGDSATARRYYRMSEMLGNQAAGRSLATLRQ